MTSKKEEKAKLVAALKSTLETDIHFEKLSADDVKKLVALLSDLQGLAKKLGGAFAKEKVKGLLTAAGDAWRPGMLLEAAAESLSKRTK